MIHHDQLQEFRKILSAQVKNAVGLHQRVLMNTMFSPLRQALTITQFQERGIWINTWLSWNRAHPCLTGKIHQSIRLIQMTFISILRGPFPCMLTPMITLTVLSVWHCRHENIRWRWTGDTTMLRNTVWLVQNRAKREHYLRLLQFIHPFLPWQPQYVMGLVMTARLLLGCHYHIK